MISGLYSAATAMEVAARQHEVTAENLANLQMPGFRRRVVPETTFETVLAEVNSNNALGSLTRLGAASRQVTHSFLPGPVQDTGRPLDMAVAGDAFFTVQGADGPLYTRNGSFHVGADGALTTVDRLPVLGAGGPLIIPAGVNTEHLEVSATGELSADGVVIGQLLLSRFDTPRQLQAAGATLFSAPQGVTPEIVQQSVLGGYLEATNVSAVEEMIGLIANSRRYDAAHRVLNAISEAAQQRIDLR